MTVNGVPRSRECEGQSSAEDLSLPGGELGVGQGNTVVQIGKLQQALQRIRDRSAAASDEPPDVPEVPHAVRASAVAPIAHSAEMDFI
jgi:hypothetical protein